MEPRSVVILEDNSAVAMVLKEGFDSRGYKVAVAANPEELETLLEGQVPECAVVDLKLGSFSGLPCVQRLRECSDAMSIVVLTGFASLATAIEAIKLGACHYLVKPSSIEEIEAAFGKLDGDPDVPVADRAASLKTHEWELIHGTLSDVGFNISEAARRLGMHRRTLARKLEKRPLL